MSVAIVITSFGDEYYWKPMYTRARVSAMRQTVPCIVKQVHYNDDEHSLGFYRNLAVSEVLATDSPDKLVFLDADDELAPDYVEKMLSVDADIVQPATLGVRPDGVEDAEPVLIPQKPLIDGNFIVIGAMLNADRFIQVNGFFDQPIYEDWDLWLRMYCAGATIGHCPEAVYKVHVNEVGRNSNASIQKEWYNAIRKDNLNAWNARGSNVR